ncbi:hypothetical protein G7Y79_00020g048270 [Physcia stellaris]|nr:hypothetical protein G7Y79_00020g048270 [Physcia stellaris]
MATTGRKLRRDQYTVSWICALDMEVAVAKAMLDEIHESTPTHESDDNHYTLGRIRKYNVVIVCLPAGVYGTTSAATVAIQMARSFTSIQTRLLVGIGGGVPTSGFDIRLGDVVVSQPQGTLGGVVQYDLGKRTQGGKFERTGQLNKPPHRLLNALTTMKGEFEMMNFDLRKYFHDNLINHSRMLEKYDWPHGEKDELYRSDYDHKGDPGQECDSCDRKNLIRRNPRRSPKEVKFHYGTIASGNSLIKDGTERDKLSKDLGGILCFEMEAAGLMDSSSCLVIRGICDYADSHKNKRWQRFAAVTAALYAKKLLSSMPGSEQSAGQQHGLHFHEASPEFAEISTPRSFGRWNSGAGQPVGSPSPGQWIPAFGPPIEQQSSAPLSQLTLELGQPIEEQNGLPPRQARAGFVEPIDHSRSSSPYHQLSTQVKASNFNQPATGYNQSSQYRVPSSDQLRQGMGRPSAYPIPAIGQRSLEGVPSTQTHSRPSLAPNRLGHSDSDIAKARGISESLGGIQKSHTGWNNGYVQPRDMIYPQYPRPSYPDRTRQRSHGQGKSTTSIPLLPLPQPQPKQSQSNPPGAPYTTSRGYESHTVGPTGASAQKPFDRSYQGQRNATAPYQGSAEYPDKGQPERSHVQALQAPKKDRKMPSCTNDPKPAASSHKENSHGLARKQLAEIYGQKGQSKESKPSTSGGHGESRHDVPRPSQNYSAPQDHAKGPKSSTTGGGGQEENHHDGQRPSQKSGASKDQIKGPKSFTGDSSGQNHHHDPQPSPTRSNPQGPAKEAKAPEKGGKKSTHHSNENAQPDHGNVEDSYDEPPPSTTNDKSLSEPDENHEDTEAASSSRPSIESELSRSPSDVEEDQVYPVPNIHVNDSYSPGYLAYGRQTPSYGQEQPLYEQEQYPYRQKQPFHEQEQYPYRQEQPFYEQKQYPHRQEQPFYEEEQFPYRQEPSSSGLEHPPFDQYLSAYPKGQDTGNDIGPHPGGEAAEYFSAGSMGEDEYLANQIIAQDQATTPYHQPRTDGRGPIGDDSSSYRKSEYSQSNDFAHTEPTQNFRDFDHEEEAATPYHQPRTGERGPVGDHSSSYRKSNYSHSSDFSHTEPTSRDLDHEEEADDSCGWCCGGGDKGSDESNDDDDNGCCGGTWTCCGDEEKSDDGEKGSCCIVM